MFIVILLSSLLGQPGATVADRDTVRALVDLYEENRTKFVEGRVWFEYTDGYAKDVAAAIRGNLTDAYQAEGFYAFRANDGIYRCVFTDDALLATATKVSGSQFVSRFVSARALTDGKVTLYGTSSGPPGGKVSHGCMIAPGIEEFYRGANKIPLELGFPGTSRHEFSQFARQALDGGSGFTLESVGDEIIEGAKTLKIKIKGSGGTSTTWIDPERAAIPIRALDEMPGNTYEVHRRDIRQIPGHGWLPFEQATIVTGGRVFRIRLTKVDFGPVPEDTFRLEFPEPVALLNSAKKVSYAPQKIWDLRRLPSANAPGVRRVEAFSPSEPTMPGVRESRPPYFTLGAVGVLSIVAIAGVWRWRRAGDSSK